MREVHKDAIEMVAETFAAHAKSALNREHPDQEQYNFYTRMVQQVRRLKSGKKNL